IVSGDLDTLQLVTPHVKLMTTRQGFQNTVIYDEAAIAERFGLRPDQIVDYKSLKGDTTDNIRGVPGVGEKTAAKLVAERRDLEGVYADIALYTDRLREALETHRDRVFRNREMVRIVTELPVTLDPERTRRAAYDRAGVVELFHELEFRSLIPRLPPADGNVPPPAPVAPTGQLPLGIEPATAAAPAIESTVVGSADAAEQARELRRAGSFAIHADVDEGRHPMLAGLGIAAGERSWYVPVEGRVSPELDALL
ncbi:MAG: 5'-3' exonuclease H3TH domain-containing protein, partial [Chloroflexota bacterium]